MYVIYKINNIPGVGAVHPQGIKSALAFFGGWNLADCPIEKIHNYKEFDFVAIPDNVVRGIQILDTFVIEDDGSPEGTITNFKLSPQDEEDVESTKKFINNIDLKLITRAKVREIKDVEDDLVDLKRLVHTLITFTVDDWNVKSSADKEKSKYKNVMNDLSIAVGENIDVLSTVERDLQKIEDIVDLEVEIANIVDTYYLTKKL